MRYIKAEKPITTKHKKLGEIEVDVEVPQFDSLEEFAQTCGGNDPALVYINNAVETAAKNGGRAMLRTAADDADLTELKSNAVKTVRDYSPASAATRGPSKAAKVEKFDAIADLLKSGKEFSKDDLLALVEASR